MATNLNLREQDVAPLIKEIVDRSQPLIELDEHSSRYIFRHLTLQEFLVASELRNNLHTADAGLPRGSRWMAGEGAPVVRGHQPRLHGRCEKSSPATRMTKTWPSSASLKQRTSTRPSPRRLSRISLTYLVRLRPIARSSPP